jgi:hypothetical protein
MSVPREAFPSERRTATEARALAKAMGEAIGRLYMALDRLEDREARTRADDLEWVDELLAAIKDHAQPSKTSCGCWAAGPTEHPSPTAARWHRGTATRPPRRLTSGGEFPDEGSQGRARGAARRPLTAGRRHPSLSPGGYSRCPIP